MRAEADIQRDLESELPDLTTAEWQRLADEGWIADAAIADLPVAGLVGLVKDWRRSAGPSMNGASRPERGLTGAHRAAVSVIHAHEASLDAGVVAFRQAHLPDGLLTAESMADWIEARTEEPSQWLVLAPDGTVETYMKRLLHYQLPGDTCQWRHAWTTHRGTLEALRALSERLAGSWRWKPAQAVSFVLCGATPIVPSMQISVRRAMPTGSRITLEIDPTQDPEVVKNVFRRVRLEEFGPQRRISEKHARMAEFAIDHPSGTWWERLTAWNSKYPHWHVNDRSNFQRDVEAATRRLAA